MINECQEEIEAVQPQPEEERAKIQLLATQKGKNQKETEAKKVEDNLNRYN